MDIVDKLKFLPNSLLEEKVCNDAISEIKSLRTQLSAMQPSKPVAYRQHIEVTKNGVTTKEYGYSDIQIMEGDDALYLAPPSAEAKLLHKEG